ncbi:FTR1 family iron permease [Halomonas litopenaei]|uniref:FTR1 family iron permease n=1 Tax=Halomonas litopenaei TaxID=2109328 RepID=UPI001A8D2CCC|nr:FTR1 family protein [Halomonas litopenaei]MBN8410766.1 FTR1 family protein [Halomonas litopenaei]
MNGAAFVVVFRESMEAILVLGVLYTWLVRAERRDALRWLWAGAMAGIALAISLGAALMGVGDVLSGDAQTLFQVIMSAVAALLIVHMAAWMRRHGATLKGVLERDAQRCLAPVRQWGIASLAALAVAREGAETLVFLYGIGVAQWHQGTRWDFVLSAGLGLVMAALCFWALQWTSRRFAWRLYFVISEALLLLVAAGLWVSALEGLINLGWLPAGMDPLWDTSQWLDDGQGVGGMLASIAGYRAWPPSTLVLGYIAYWWLVIMYLQVPLRRQSRDRVAS